MMAFPITELLDEQACYEFLLSVLHPQGLRCPAGHKVAPGQAPHMSDRAPVMDYRCRRCGRVFNVFTTTLWKGTHYSCRQVVLLVRGFAQGVPTLHLARELDLDYETVLTRRHSWQEQALKKSPDATTRPGDGRGRNVSERG
jgi:transposase-like protein